MGWAAKEDIYFLTMLLLLNQLDIINDHATFLYICEASIIIEGFHSLD